jgi:predicted dehydrogenase
MRGAVVGAGLLGTRRAVDLLSIDDTRVSYVCDPDATRGAALAERLERRQQAPCRWLESPTALLAAERVDVALVAVPHDQAVPVVRALLEAGLDTLVEKPMGLNLAEARRLADLAERGPARLAVGFNYRHYPAVVRAKRLVEAGTIGRPLLLRMLLGHGGRPGYEQEWKLSRSRSGGGVLLDPGIHLLDLARFFLGEVEAVQSHRARLFWPVDVEDSAVAVLRGERGAEAHLQTSLVEWQNRFSVHLFGDEGYIKIDGRMGNYGTQRLVLGRRWAWLEGASQAAGDQIESFGDEDVSYRNELQAVIEALRSGGPLPADHHDGLAAMQLVDDLYRLAGPVAQML